MPHTAPRKRATRRVGRGLDTKEWAIVFVGAQHHNARLGITYRAEHGTECSAVKPTCFPCNHQVHSDIAGMRNQFDQWVQDVIGDQVIIINHQVNLRAVPPITAGKLFRRDFCRWQALAQRRHGIGQDLFCLRRRVRIGRQHVLRDRAQVCAPVVDHYDACLLAA